MSLNRSHYGILLSGCAAEEGKQEIPPIFHESFSKENKIRGLGENWYYPFDASSIAELLC